MIRAFPAVAARQALWRTRVPAFGETTPTASRGPHFGGGGYRFAKLVDGIVPQVPVRPPAIATPEPLSTAPPPPPRPPRMPADAGPQGPAPVRGQEPPPFRAGRSGRGRAMTEPVPAVLHAMAMPLDQKPAAVVANASAGPGFAAPHVPAGTGGRRRATAVPTGREQLRAAPTVVGGTGQPKREWMEAGRGEALAPGKPAEENSAPAPAGGPEAPPATVRQSFRPGIDTTRAASGVDAGIPRQQPGPAAAAEDPVPAAPPVWGRPSQPPPMSLDQPGQLAANEATAPDPAPPGSPAPAASGTARAAAAIPTAVSEPLADAGGNALEQLPPGTRLVYSRLPAEPAIRQMGAWSAGLPGQSRPPEMATMAPGAAAGRLPDMAGAVPLELPRAQRRSGLPPSRGELPRSLAPAGPVGPAARPSPMTGHPASMSLPVTASPVAPAVGSDRYRGDSRPSAEASVRPAGAWSGSRPVPVETALGPAVPAPVGESGERSVRRETRAAGGGTVSTVASPAIAEGARNSGQGATAPVALEWRHLPEALPEAARQWLDRQPVSGWDGSRGEGEQMQVECRYDEQSQLRMSLQAGRGQLVVQVRELPAELRAWFGSVRDELAQSLKRLGYEQVDYRFDAESGGRQADERGGRHGRDRHESRLPQVPFAEGVALGDT